MSKLVVLLVSGTLFIAVTSLPKSSIEASDFQPPANLGFDLALVRRAGPSIQSYSSDIIVEDLDQDIDDEEDVLNDEEDEEAEEVDDDESVGIFNDTQEEEETSDDEAVEILNERLDDEVEEEDVDDDTVEYVFSAFGKDYRLKFERNFKLIPPGFRVKFRNGEDDDDEPKGNSSSTRLFEVPDSLRSCHFHHVGENSLAALSDCRRGGLRGFVSPMMEEEEEEAFEIAPLSQDQKQLVEALQIRYSSEELYTVSKVRLPSFKDEREGGFTLDGQGQESFEVDGLESSFLGGFPLEASVNGGTLSVETELALRRPRTVELGVFVDRVASSNLAELARAEVEDGDEEKVDEVVVESVLATLNQVAAIYKHPSLRAPIQDKEEEEEEDVDAKKSMTATSRGLAVSVVRLDILEGEEPPKGLKDIDGERVRTLTKFCAYSKSLNIQDDAAPEHWDLGVMLTGRDLWQKSRWGKRFDTLGLAPTGGICDKQASCLVVEFAARPDEEDGGYDSEPYPTTGFGAAYVLAHEMGHSLGMTHDGVRGNECSGEGFIMSASRETGGETGWSECSARVFSELSKGCLRDEGPGGDLGDRLGLLEGQRLEVAGGGEIMPGQIFNADRQCQRFMADSTAFAATHNPDPCQTLRCKREQGRTFKAGPALDGTDCQLQDNTPGMCVNGNCSSNEFETRSAATLVQNDGWSLVSVGKCSSGCLRRSRAVRKVIKMCQREEGCEDGVLKGELVETTELCKEDDRDEQCQDDDDDRQTNRDWAEDRCVALAEEVGEAYPEQVRGSQALYSALDPSVACRVYCKLPGDRWWRPAGKLFNRVKPILDGEDADIVTKPGRSRFKFPDGSWCHRRRIGDSEEGEENGNHFYCLQGKCQPEE